MILVAALSFGCLAALVVGRIAGVAVLTGRTAPHRRSRAHAAPRRAGLATRLVQAGSPVTVTQLIAGSAVLGGITLLVLFALTGSIGVALVPAAVVAGLPHRVIAGRRRERLAALRRAWPDGLREISAALAAGATVTQAVEQLAAQGPEAIRGALARFPALARMLGTAAALDVLREEIADPTTDRVVEVLIVAHERGGTVVRTVVDDLARATTRDLRLDDELETEGLEMRINARAVVALPWAVLVLLCARPGPFREFYASGRGIVVLFVGGAMSALGYALVRRLGQTPEEPRVFGGASR